MTNNRAESAKEQIRSTCISILCQSRTIREAPGGARDGKENAPASFPMLVGANILVIALISFASALC